MLNHTQKFENGRVNIYKRTYAGNGMYNIRISCTELFEGERLASFTHADRQLVCKSFEELQSRIEGNKLYDAVFFDENFKDESTYSNIRLSSIG